MSFKLKNKESASKGIKRIITGQIENALRELNDDSINLEEAVHDSRTGFKKIRAALRLVKDGTGKEAFAEENTFFRDAGRKISSFRDTAVLISTLDKIIENYPGEPDKAFFDKLRNKLIVNSSQSDADKAELGKKLKEEFKIIAEQKSKINSLKISGNNISLLFRGLRRVYSQGRKAMIASSSDPKVENYHEWRKRVKYLWYCVKILRCSWSNLFKELAKSLHELSDLLGDAHDYFLLKNYINRYGIIRDAEKKKSLNEFIEANISKLYSEAEILGRKIYFEKPKDFANRIINYLLLFKGKKTKILN